MANMPEHTPAPTPSRAVYGFVFYLSFQILFLLYLLWAFIPESWFRYLGITCLPQRYWAVAVPIYIITAILLFAFIIYPSINLCMTPNLDDFQTITDKTARNKSEIFSTNATDTAKCVCKDSTKCSKEKYLKISSNFKTMCIPSAADIDIAEISQILYSKPKIQ